MVLVFVPDIGLRGLVRSEEAVMPQPVDEEPVALHADLLHALFVLVAQERAGNGKLRIHRVPDRFALIFDGPVVILHPLPGLLPD